MAQLGDIVASTFNPGIVTASYFASLCGCLLTIELIHRRGTGVRNYKSWLETFACAITLGLIGIWCMHFIGNRAIILGDGAAAIQLVYSPGYSTLSVFLPIIGLTIAFGAAEFPVTSPILHWIALSCTGTFAGLSIVGMHYIGNFGASNYRLEYVPRYLAGSIVIAIGDCLAVLILFYTWRDKWISDWWKRLLCAAALAGGVSAMHFTASTNCIYQLKHYNSPEAIRSRDVQVIVAGILCGAAAIVVVCVMFVFRHKVQVLKKASRKVMLACAMFSPDGRILVTTQGVLPSKEITERYEHVTFSDDFDTAHPVFQWIFRVSHNWTGILDLIPKMKSHLAGLKNTKEDSRPTSSRSSAHYEWHTYSDYTVIFRERFCTAAASLAASMHIPVESIGVLYDKIIDTGTLTPEEQTGKRVTMQKDDLESAMSGPVFGRGQLLFLTRQLDAEETDNLLNAGFRFANVQHVGRTIAGAMQIPIGDLDMHMNGLRRYVETMSTMEKAGTWLSCFVLMPKPHIKGGFDVMVKRDEQDQLPDVQLSPFELQPWQTAFLSRLHNISTSVCQKFLEDRDRRDAERTPQEQHFAMSVLQALNNLSKQIPQAWYDSARFVGTPVQAQYSQPFHNHANATILYSLVVCADLHSSTESRKNLTRVPLSFFNVRQQCYTGSPNHLVLVQDIHQEFGPILTRKGGKPSNPPERPTTLKKSRTITTSQSRRPSVAFSGSEPCDSRYSSDTYELVDKPHHIESQDEQSTSGVERDNIWGGILVNSETVIESDTKNDTDMTINSTNLGLRTAVGTVKAENTFVDELFNFARENIATKAWFPVF